MPGVHVDPDGWFAIEAAPRAVELWTVVPVRFDPKERPGWQHRKGGAVARLHTGLRAMQAVPGDMLVAAFSDPSGDRPDVENRLFTNAKEPPEDTPKGMPNPFTHLPRSIAFERRFEAVHPPGRLVGPAVHYRYALEPAGTWTGWEPVAEPLATWREVGVTGVSEGAGWPIWLGMAVPGADVRVSYDGPPLKQNFAVELMVHTGRALQVVTVMEAVIDGVVASFQRESDPLRARRVADVLRRKPKLGGVPVETLVAAQVDAPAILATPPWAINSKGTWAQLAPADRWVVAGRVTISHEAGRENQALSGRLLRVKPALTSSDATRRPSPDAAA